MVSNLSYWEKKHFYHADIIIVGSGIVGLNAAIEIKSKQPKMKILVLERGFLPSGASTKNAGFACFGSISELIEQELRCGTDELHRLISKRWNGLIKLRKLLGDKDIQYENFGGYELFRPDQQVLADQCVSKLGHFNDLIADIVGQKNVFRESNNKIKDFGFANTRLLIENLLEAQLDPGMMIKSLLSKSLAMGIEIFNSVSVKKISHEENTVSLQTDQGIFRCQKVIVTNNAFVKELIPNLDVEPGRGQVLVTDVIQKLKVKGTFHYDRGYYYFRNIDGRILLGGGRNLDFEGEKTTEFGSTELIQNALRKLLKEVILPGVPFEIAHSWSGIMAFGSQLAPIVEEVDTNVFVAARCNGMGIAMGTATGQDVAELVLQKL